MRRPHREFHQDRGLTTRMVSQDIFTDTRLVVTDSVLTEVANFFAEYGEII